jgi:hypothetical protein
MSITAATPALARRPQTDAASVQFLRDLKFVDGAADPHSAVDRVALEPQAEPYPEPPPPRRTGPTRAVVETPSPIDYSALPVVVAAAPTHVERTFVLSRTDLTSKSCPPRFVPRTKIWWGFSPSWNRDFVVRIGGALIPPPKKIGGRYEDPDRALEGVFNLARETHADWVGIDEFNRTAERVPIVRFEGAFDSKAMRAVADKELSGVAEALIPGTLYAFRRCDAGCEQPLSSDARVEELEIIAPKSIWIGSSGSSERQRMRVDASFTDVSVRVDPGTSATISVAVTAEAIASFRGSLVVGAPTLAPITTFSIEALRPLGAEPELTLFTGEFDGTADQMGTGVPPPTAATDGRDCLYEVDDY